MVSLSAWRLAHHRRLLHQVLTLFKVRDDVLIQAWFNVPVNDNEGKLHVNSPGVVQRKSKQQLKITSVSSNHLQFGCETFVNLFAC